MLGRSKIPTALISSGGLPSPRLVKNGVVLIAQPKPSYLTTLQDVKQAPPGAEPVPLLEAQLDQVMFRMFGKDVNISPRCDEPLEFEEALVEEGVHSNKLPDERCKDYQRRRWES